MVNTHMKIGKLRRILFMPFDCKWNAWVRDFTAWLEGWLFPKKGCSHDWHVTGAIPIQGNHRTWWKETYTCSRCGATAEGPFLVSSLKG